MSKLNQTVSNQLTLGAFSQGNFVALDGGKRLRMDDRVDYWPATGKWLDTVTGETGMGVTGLLGHVARLRAEAGQPIQRPAPIETERRLTCNYCGQPARLHAAQDVYPNDPRMVGRHAWVCWPCDAWVGCHRGDDGRRPLGSLAKEDLRAARQAAHRALDSLWQGGEMPREAAYEWLARKIEIPVFRCHIAMMDVEECRRVVEVVDASRQGPGGWDE